MEWEGPSIWQSTRTFWTSCWLVVTRSNSERMLSAELDDHLENEGAAGAINRRNGSSRKTMLTGTSKVTLDVPRDRAGTFDPKLITKYQRRFPDFDDKIISMYARGMTVREIRGHHRCHRRQLG